MPTDLPPRREVPPSRVEPGYRDIMIAATLLLSVLCLICEQALGPTPGYSLVKTLDDLQLSP